MLIFRKLLFFYLSFFLLNWGHCQFIGKSFVINYSKQLYNADNQNWSIAINSDRNIYFGNNKGLLEFDGSNWKLLEMPEQMVVRSVAIGNDDRIFVGAFQEFGYWKKDSEGQFFYTSLSDSLGGYNFHNEEIWRIISHKDKFYFQSFSAIYVYDGKKTSIIKPEATVVVLIEARNRLFIHGVGKGLFEIVDDKLHFISGSEILAGDEIKIVLPFGEKDFLIGGANKGFHIYDGTTFRFWDIPANETFKTSELNCGIAVGNTFIIGTIVNGIFIIDEKGKILEHLNTKNFLQNNTVLSLCPDKYGNIWAGLDRGIDYVMRDNPLDFYINPAGNPTSVYAAALLNENLYIGTNQGLTMYRFEPQIGFTDPVLVKGTQGQVWHLEIIDGELLCGHTNGTFRIENEKAEKISDINGGFEIKKITRENKEYLIQSTYSSIVIYRKTNNKWEYSNIIKGFMEPIIHFEIDHLGNLWAQHLNLGLYMIKINPEIDSAIQVKHFEKKHGFDSDRNIQVAKIANRVVFGTGKMLYTYDDLNDSILPYVQLNQKLGKFKETRRIIPVNDTLYWFIHDQVAALYTITAKLLKPLFQYDLAMQGLNFVTASPEIKKVNNSIHVFCLDDGFAIFDENKIPPTSKPDKVRIWEIAVKTRNSKTIYLPLNSNGKKTKISHSYKNLSINFSSPKNYIYSKYRYKLEGLDPGWSDWSKTSTVYFNLLPSGNYTFKVQAKSIGEEESEVSSFPFTIKNPWYGSVAAKVLYTLIFIFIIIYFRITFVKRLKKHARKLDKRIREKQRQEILTANDNFIKLQNEKLATENSFKSAQLANYTMTILRKNELLIQLKEEIYEQKEELGLRYPNYHYNKILTLIEKNISSEDDWKTFEFHFDHAHENFFRRLKLTYPELTPSDLKLSAYLKLNLSSKEIAPLLNISVRGIEIARYRLRKRLHLKTEENLIEFLIQF